MNATELSDLVKQGLMFHLAGDLEQAGRVYGEVLSADPHRADALHLFGIILYQLGDPQAAIEAISRACAFWPNKAHFHVNLAEIYRSMGQTDRARGSLILARNLRPAGFDCREEFDLLLQRPGQFDDLDLPTRQPHAPAPDKAILATELANLLRSEGDRAGALWQSFEAVRLAPGVGLPESNLGQALLELGRLQEALNHCSEAVRLAPDLPEAWNHLGNVYWAMSRSVEARSCYLEALRLRPDLVVVLNNIGRVLVDALCLKDALAWFRMALTLDPASISIRTNVAWTLRELGKLDEALELARETLCLAPESDESHLCLGSILHELRQFEEASRSFDRAIRFNPNYLLAHQSQGTLLTEMANPAGAEKAFREVLRLPGDPARALFGLANLLRGRLPESDLVAIEQKLSNPDLPDRSRAELHFAASIVHDARGAFKASADHLRTANAIRQSENFRMGRAYSPGDHEHFVERMIKVCSTDYFEKVEGFGLPSDRPLFIFGLPRSGTSLTEQILASHSKVQGLGETEFARKNFDSIPSLIGSRDDAVDCLARLDRESVVALARSHMARLDAIDGTALRLIDKMPENYLYLGFLATLFPNARFIHCRRDLRDVAVSCWSTNFRYLDWPNSLDHIADRFAMYQRIMEHWEQVLPIPILTIDYEETVGDLETTARSLVEWAGLDWEPACLNFHETRRVVRTASVTQVREPIYRRSLDRWKNYETELAELFERLDVGVKV